MAFASFALFGLLIVISPGADFLLVFRNSVRYGRRAGLFTALGIALSVTIHVSYSITGMSQLISQTPQLFTLIRYVGAAYLIYLGIRSFIGAKLTLPDLKETQQRYHALQMLRQGFLCNLLNPKTIIFFISVFAQLMAAHPEQLPLVALYGIYIALLHGLWFALLALGLTAAKLVAWIERFNRQLNQLCGLGLMSFGIILSLPGTL
ncbi:LysE family translocator [Celerinatantimonas sp. YJH-8]|uniref:LysE family translocator n=1 Tax=Celerinatantimonas sp. YJH-8 TaxID=3228714 RepID=UPI0038CA6834